MKPGLVTENVLVDLDDEQLEVDVTVMVYPPTPDTIDGPGTDWSIDVYNVRHNSRPVSDSLWETAVFFAHDDITRFIDSYTMALERDNDDAVESFQDR